MSKIGIIALLMVAQSAWADFAPVRAKIEAAMEAEVRTEQDRARDRNRMPIRTLANRHATKGHHDHLAGNNYENLSINLRSV